MPERRAAVAAAVATIAFWAYTRTLLPGVDPGDTGGFQAAVLWPFTSARRAYPLYYALASPFVSTVSAADPARGLNLFSALCGAIAAGLLTWLVGAIARSAAAGALAGLLLAFSYTFWTQAVIAEVYTLHLALICACMLALAAFAHAPSHRRLAIVLALYALSFGNHLATILLAVPVAIFLLHVHPAPRTLLRPRVLLMACAIAAAGALQYSANMAAAYASAGASAPWTDVLASFWFDTTKADWRETMVLGVDTSELAKRTAMWAWDARQQFGLAGLLLAGIGAVRLWRISRPWAAFLAIAYGISTAFALTYNVGDPHVFFLPGHMFTALAAGMALAAPATPLSRGRQLLLGLFAAAALLYAGWRGWDTWPAADRHRDYRADAAIGRLIAGLDERQALLVSAMDWEMENALLYTTRYRRPGITWTRLADVLPHFPFLVRDNHQAGRDLVLTAEAAQGVAGAFGPLFPLVSDATPAIESLSQTAGRIPAGAPYVLTILTPPRGARLDDDDLDRALVTLTANRPPSRTPGAYEVVAGRAGAPALLYRSSDRPFRVRIAVDSEPITIRLDGWMPFDMFRRGGFGHAILDRRREALLTIERGVSLGWLGADGGPRSRYAAGLYEPRPRFRIPAAPLSPGFARRTETAEPQENLLR